MLRPLAVHTLVASLLSLPGPAQSIQATATAPIALSIASGATPLYSGTVPVGVLPASSSITIGIPGTQAQLGWFATQANTSLTFSVNWSTTMSSPLQRASLQGQGILLALTAPFASQAVLELAVENSGFTAASPTLAIDVGDDGIAEATELHPANSIAVVLGPVPTLVRVTITANQVDSGASTLFLRCAPDSGSDVQAWNIGCEAVPVRLLAQFDSNFELGAFPNVGQPTLGVFSLQLQSVLLGSSFGLPCLLLPAPDVVLLFPTASVSTIVVPPAVRPLFFFAQGVALGIQGLATGTAYVARAR